MILVVTYDLSGPAGAYGDFYDALRRQGTWWHYLKSTWLLSSDKSPKEVFDALQPHMRPSDHILIVEMGESYYGSLPKAAWDWIRQHQQDRRYA